MRAEIVKAETVYSRLSKWPLQGLAAVLLAAFLFTPSAKSQTQGPVRITLDEAVQMALQHNHNMLAMMTTIQQSQAEEITQGLRPNPALFADWEYLPLGSPSHQNLEPVWR